jgi:ABC-type antimicrobial peptide transport system permease subunit
MIKTNFPINDLRRRKFQTSISIITLTLSVASTLFLLMLTNRIGLGTSSAAGILTSGLTGIFSQFIIFIGVLIFIIGAVLTAFAAFLMMMQRTRDFGLIKAVGCPNNLIGGYLMGELLITTIVGCTLGVGLGFLVDFVVSKLMFLSYQLPNFLFAPLVFVAFFIVALVFGLQPVIKASRMSALQALSPVNYYGLTATGKHKTLSKSALTWRLASRSLTRRQSASIRVIILLSIVFILLTVSVGGGIIASCTTTAWVQQSSDQNVILVAHSSMADQYKKLLAKFTGGKATGDFDYSNIKLAIPDAAIQQIKSLPNVIVVDSRLMLKEHVKEISNFTINPENGETFPVGGDRQADLLVIGVDPSSVVSSWFVQGHFFTKAYVSEAVIGDSVANTMYAATHGQNTMMSKPLLESMELRNNTFNIVGVCIDPLSNGQIVYMPLLKIMNITGDFNPNLLLIKLDSSADQTASIQQIKTTIQFIDPDLNAYELNDVVAKNTAFLDTTWQTIMLLPLFTLASAALCLVGYMMLTVDEQRQEFAVLRAVGAKSNRVVSILSIQSMIVLLSSFAIGISLGTMITLVILLHQPIVTTFTLIQISGWLLAALTGMFLLSLYPALKLAKTSILKIMT